MKSQPIYKRKRHNKTASIQQEKFTDKKRKKAEADRHTRGGF
ncbi:hypothetical protein [Aquisalibacillus elongatus]|uniref:Uncharacterized protein n=1 Tax=Aquisalibacillus elongatus TaxID=485577 RepID=A0A3N5B3V4_9BACI|nr:hypothetical protein [Aquisalibacillus elongatus]RPF52084.1 hypothetical protein EDC24_2074 [Aquisalibacillus elongatus]